MDTTTKPTVVFVHGAWADNSGWDGSIRALRGQGFRAIGAANPLRGLRSDAAYVAALLRSIAGPIVMVGHSYGGAVISNAATGNDQVQALVYISRGVGRAPRDDASARSTTAPSPARHVDQRGAVLN